MLGEHEIEDRILAFKADLKRLRPLDVVRKNIIHGSCAIIDDQSYFTLRGHVADQYEIHPNEIIIVGSRKLGFSIAPLKQYRHFSEQSDIDLVVVSAALFDKVWRAVYDYERTGGYWERSGPFKKYLFQGWIRPDKLPPDQTFAFASEWWKFFNKLSYSGQYSVYKINGALYRDWRFLESYQLKSVDGCANALSVENTDED